MNNELLFECGCGRRYLSPLTVQQQGVRLGFINYRRSAGMKYRIVTDRKERILPLIKLITYLY